VRAPVSLEASLALPQVSAHGTDSEGRQRGPAIFVPLSAANDDLTPIEVHVLDAKADALEDAQPAPVHQYRA